MNLKKELADSIKSHFRLNIYATTVWLALLSKGIASAGEIAELSDVPRSRTYDVLESLEKQGFAMQKIGKPVKYMAVKPISVIDKLKKNAMSEMNEKVDILSNIKDTQEYKELESLHSSQSELIRKQDISGTISGRTNINSQISDVLNLAKKEVIICAPCEEIRRRIKLLEPIIRTLDKNGIKIIFALKGDAEEIKQISDKLKIKAKNIDINASFYIADKTEILFMLNSADAGNEQMAVWFSSPFFVQSFSTLFDMALKRK